MFINLFNTYLLGSMTMCLDKKIEKACCYFRTTAEKNTGYTRETAV